MKKSSILVVVLIFAVLLSFTAISKVDQVFKKEKKIETITPKITLEKNDNCETTFYDAVQRSPDVCEREITETHCLNTTGKNTGCSDSKKTIEYNCVKEIVITKNKTVCKEEPEFIIEVHKPGVNDRKKLDFSDFGPCVYEEKNSCLVVTCVSWHDGAHNGEYTECRPGMSCQRIEICENDIRKFERNSGESFVSEDETFQWKKLELQEVAE